MRLMTIYLRGVQVFETFNLSRFWYALEFNIYVVMENVIYLSSLMEAFKIQIDIYCVKLIVFLISFLFFFQILT